MAGAKPSGIFVDAASDLVAKHIPAPKPAERDLALAEAQKAYEAAVAEFQGQPAELSFLRQAAVEAGLNP